MKSMGIIGYGSFGSLLARLLAPHIEVVVYDQKPITEQLPQGVRQASPEELAGSDVIVLATDLSSIRPICKQIAGLVKPETIVMDICSVKVKPAGIMTTMLGSKCRLLATHPLFGPNSVAANGDNCQGLTMIWHELEGGPFPELEHLFSEQLGVQLRRMTPEEHDREMAWIHALTFFVGRALVDMDIPELTLDTGYYQKLRELLELEKTHSQALFDTIEAGNPFAAAVREQFIATLQKLDAQVKEIEL